MWQKQICLAENMQSFLFIEKKKICQEQNSEAKQPSASFEKEVLLSLDAELTPGWDFDLADWEPMGL